MKEHIFTIKITHFITVIFLFVFYIHNLLLPRFQCCPSIYHYSIGTCSDLYRITTRGTLYKAFIRPILTYAFPGCFPFSSPTHITSVERMHRSSCRVIRGCLLSTPIPLLHIEGLLPPLRVTLTHQSLSFFERALCLPSTFFIASFANSNPRTHLKNSSWRSFSRSHDLTPNLYLACEPLILCPPKPPGLSHLLTQSHSISHSHALAKTPLPFATLQLPPTFPPYLTAISLPGLMVRYLAGWGRVVQGYTSSVQKCVTATSLSFLTSLWATSYSAKTFAILHALEWCISHSKTCNFESITFFSDSLSVLSTLSAPYHI